MTQQVEAARSDERLVPAARALAEWAIALRWDRVPAAAQARTKELLLDHLACACGGAEAASSRLVAQFARDQGTGVATIIGDGAGSPAWAALANGAASHALELDDVAHVAFLHPGVTVGPAVLAVAEEVGASGADLVRAFLIGYEVVMRMGSALHGPSVYARGFHPTGVAGAFGATAAAATLRGLDADGFARALGIAGTMASGSLEYVSDGSWTKRLTPGWAAHAGVIASALARRGFTGPATALDGRLGALHAYSDAGDARRLTDGLGAAFMVMRVAVKPYGCCRWNHGLIDAMIELRGRGITAADVVSIELGVHSSGALLVADPIERKRDPQSVVEAQFSAPFAAAVALVTGRAGRQEFSDASLRDPEIRRLMRNASCFTDPAIEAPFPQRLPSIVRARLRDGRVVTITIEQPSGEPETWPGAAALVERFHELARAIVRDPGAFAARVLAVEREPDVRPLLADLRRA